MKRGVRLKEQDQAEKISTLRAMIVVEEDIKGLRQATNAVRGIGEILRRYAECEGLGQEKNPLADTPWVVDALCDGLSMLSALIDEKTLKIEAAIAKLNRP